MVDWGLSLVGSKVDLWTKSGILSVIVAWPLLPMVIRIISSIGFVTTGSNWLSNV